MLLTGLAAGLAYVTVNNLLLTFVWTLHEGRSPLRLGQAQAVRASSRSVGELREANERVGEFAHRIAERLGLDEDELRAIAVGAVIHDIGKIGIPDAVLLKRGKLDDDEWATMRHHHERYDGTGYPDGLRGENIPLAARILTVADTLDAMTSDRPYRKAMPIGIAREELIAKAGTQFCPRVVAAALDVT